MKPIQLLVIHFFLSIPLFAQNISGKVNDGKTDFPLEGVSIQVGRAGVRAVTDPQGIFSLQANPGDSIILTAIGYEKHLYIFKGEKNIVVYLNPNNTVLNEVTVVGYENNRKLKEVAGGVAVVTGRELRRGDMSSIAPALNSIPGVRMEEQTPGGSVRLSIRGSVLRSPFGIRGVKAYWNDIPYSSADGNTPAYFFDPSLISGIEILKGPSGSIYGAGTGGVIIVNSNRPSFREKSAEASFVAGSYGLMRYGLTLKSSSEDADITALYSEQRYGGYRELQSATYRKLFNITASLYSGEKRKVFISIFNARNNVDLPGAVDKQTFETNPRFTNPYIDSIDARLTNNYTNLAVSQRYRFNEKLSNTTSLYGSFTNTDHPIGSSPFSKSYFKSGNNSLGARTRFVYQPGGTASKTKFTAGAEYQRGVSTEKEYENNYGHPGNIHSDQELKTQQYIMFLQAEIDLPAGFIATAGASYNKLQYKIQDLFNPTGDVDYSGKLDFDGTIAPRVALVKKVTKDISVHASVSTGFGPPTAYELSPVGQINTSLKSEYGTNYEIGTRGSLLAQRLSFDISVYTMKLNDIIISRRLDNGTDAYSNSGSANQRGIELLLSYSSVLKPNGFVNFFKPWLTWNYQHYRFDEFHQVDESNPGNTKNYSGNKIPGIPEQVLSAGADVSLRAGLYANILLQHFGKRYITNENKPQDVASAYQVLNARIGFKKSFHHFTIDIFGGGNNLLDQRYSEFIGINGFGGRYFMASPQANFYSGIQLKYSLQ